MNIWSNLFFNIDEEQLINIYIRIFPFHKLMIYFILLQILIGSINLFCLNNEILGVLEIFFFANIGIVTAYIQVPVFYIIYSIVSIIGCLIHFNNTSFRNITLSDLNSVICISVIINHLSCSILSLKIFLIIINGINWESKFMSICGNLHITYIGYPRFNNSSSNIGYYTPLEESFQSNVLKKSSNASEYCD
ncbi:transmembrane domain-containing protein [Cryptosporidium ubiquitum]|uniref:Transmembrane domain-containing protein n=1 Tax=Cryptosporidium ubiquitum TaxID=857276 RepID=A0A1J4MK82_9CRYT|nr:transmembrane domain-containing protein [Cryptosporidium ubiquitum]OII74624.1 transmembrane domain-containing protein [Cryptosporidium ubiquitum]